MGKRSSFTRIEKDFYPTIDPSCVSPLLFHVQDVATYHEPCFGKGHLVNLLNEHSHMECTHQGDLEEPAELLTECHGEVFLTNPPWTRKILHPIIDNLAGIAPTWLLFDASWACTQQAEPYLKYCEKIVVVGRMYWMDNKIKGKDDVAWYLFDKKFEGVTKFYGRSKGKFSYA